MRDIDPRQIRGSLLSGNLELVDVYLEPHFLHQVCLTPIPLDFVWARVETLHITVGGVVGGLVSMLPSWITGADPSAEASGTRGRGMSIKAKGVFGLLRNRSTTEWQKNLEVELDVYEKIRNRRLTNHEITCAVQRSKSKIIIIKFLKFKF